MTVGPHRIRVLLLYGGRSAEHDVSCVSAVSAARALDPERYEVLPVSITKEGQWLFSDVVRAAIARRELPEALPVEGTPVELPARPGARALERAGTGTGTGAPVAPVDVVVPLLHGPYGEDGTLQGLLEMAGVPYVGCGVLGSAVAMDKIMMKRAFAAAGLPSPAHVPFREGHDLDALVRAVEVGFGYPCFVKPANLGSSVGVSRARDRVGLRGAVAAAVEFDEWVLVEEAIGGREIEVGILGDDPPEASVPGEIVPGDDFYTYADKYERQDARLLAPAPLDAADVARAQELAVRAFESCRVEAMARVDLFLETERSRGAPRGFLVNEVNTMPGMTSISMFPRLWELSGVAYPALFDRLIELAFARHARRAARAGRQRAVVGEPGVPAGRDRASGEGVKG